MLKMYDLLAQWWPLLSPPEDYEEEAGLYLQTLRRLGRPTSGASLLELGAGGGNNASFMKAAFDYVVLTDLSDGMLAHSRRLNPGCEHHVADMRTLRLDQQFDAVFVQDAICYMTTPADLQAAITTAVHHCKPGGVVLLAPDTTEETFRPNTDCGGVDDPNSDRAMRWLEWVWDPTPGDGQCLTDYTLVVRDGLGLPQVHHERHVEGLFPRQTWLDLMAAAGLDAQRIPLEHSELPPGSYEVFAGIRRA